MIKIVFILLMAALHFFNSCVTDPNTIKNSNTDIIMFSDPNSVTIHTDAAEIKELTIRGDRLYLTVTYGGGCKEHDFSLFGDKTFLESYPVQAHVYLSHNTNKDDCEAWITDKLEFSLVPLKTVYQNAYADSGTILITLFAPGANEHFQPFPIYSFY